MAPVRFPWWPFAGCCPHHLSPPFTVPLSHYPVNKGVNSPKIHIKGHWPPCSCSEGMQCGLQCVGSTQSHRNAKSQYFPAEHCLEHLAFSPWCILLSSLPQRMKANGRPHDADKIRVHRIISRSSDAHHSFAFVKFT